METIPPPNIVTNKSSEPVTCKNVENPEDLTPLPVSIFLFV
jgi:hypothetical protein